MRIERFAPRALLATVLAALALVCSGCEFWQYNIGNGHVDPQYHGENDVITRVTSGERPVAMTLNEVCRTSFNQMKAALAPYGYTGWYDETSSGGMNCPEAIGYGNAIFHLGKRDSFPGCSEPVGCSNGIIRLHYATNRPDTLHHSDALGVGIRAGNLRALVWVTHLEAGDESAASDQASQLLGAVRYWQAQSGLLPVVGGDFNLTPSQPPMGDWCGSFRESFGCSSGAPTHPTEGKIDYLFSSIRWRSAATFSSPNSDHKRLTGRLG